MAETCRVFISYSHDSPSHRDRILSLSNRLRTEGIDCRIDQYEESPEEGWPTWCDRQVEESNFVLVACTEIYLRRFKKREAHGTGLGATWEGHIITQELYESQGRNSKFIPIIFLDTNAQFVPTILRSATRYSLPGEYDRLYRRLTGQPETPMPPLAGSIKSMPPRQALPSLPTLERKQEIQRVWVVPYQRNPFFTGREQILADLREKLVTRKRAALSGFGGKGKTHTAIEYAFRHREHYNHVFWVRAEKRDTLLADLAGIAGELELPSATEREQDRAVAEAKQWLETYSGWLLIFDNVEDLALLREFLPSDATGHVLLTTQLRALGGLAERVEVPEMQPDEAVQLLLRRSKAKDSVATRSAARQIGEELGYLPLALDQAGAFIEETPSNLSEYLSFLRGQKDKILAERGSLGDHPSVTVTFSLAFSKVAAYSPKAADLIRLCAFLAPDAIPEEIFTDGLDYSAFEFTQILKEATRFSLIDRDPDSKTLDIHRLVQAIVRAGMSETEQREWAERAVRAVNAAFPYVQFENWPLCQKILPHALACTGLIDHWSFEFREAARLLNQAAFYLYERAPSNQAEPLYQHSLRIYKKVLGLDHPLIATVLNNLAQLYLDQGKYAKTEPLYKQALAIFERALGPSHPSVATALNNLAMLYRQQGKYVEAEPLYKQSLAIDEKTYGTDHPEVATDLNNLAALYRYQGKYAEAEPLFGRALAICEKALGPDHPDVPRSLNNLAVLYHDQGKYAEALPLYQRALAIHENALGPEHPRTVETRSNLELCLAALNSPQPPHPS
jgi:tetratricopeptide (TPR) repeat protein